METSMTSVRYAAIKMGCLQGFLGSDAPVIQIAQDVLVCVAIAACSDIKVAVHIDSLKKTPAWQRR